jgi:diguanylate cyclase (GGDEF)-like protein
MLLVSRPADDPFRPEDSHLLARVAAHLARRVAGAHRLELAHRDAETDPLTGLPNRRTLARHAEMELDRARRESTSLGVLLVDVDRFKQINDTLGHATGDHALWLIAESMRQSVRPYDTCVRYAGDEFVVLMPGCGPHDLEARRLELQQKIGALELSTPDGGLHLSASVGGATFPADASTLQALLDLADKRMYEDKAARRGAASVDAA